MNIEKAWPDGTFVWEEGDQRHYCGSHWDPFFDSPDNIFGALSEIVPASVPLTTFGDTYSGPHEIPANWTMGGHICWPNANRGLVATLRVTESETEIMNVSPFAGVGTQVGMDIEKVHVWNSRAEAQIEGVWGESEVSFFDLTFLSNRAWYEAGQRREFILAGIAYDAGAPKVKKLTLASSSSLANWLTRIGLAKTEGTDVLLEGSSVFVPLADRDRDDYWFRGPAREVAVFDDWLGQSGWKIRVSVMQFENESADLDVFVTERAWTGSEPPRVGQDIEGSLWLQGRMWSAV